MRETVRNPRQVSTLRSDRLAISKGDFAWPVILMGVAEATIDRSSIIPPLDGHAVDFISIWPMALFVRYGLNSFSSDYKKRPLVEAISAFTLFSTLELLQRQAPGFGIYDPWDFAAFGLGALTFVTASKVNNKKFI